MAYRADLPQTHSRLKPLLQDASSAGQITYIHPDEAIHCTQPIHCVA